MNEETMATELEAAWGEVSLPEDDTAEEAAPMKEEADQQEPSEEEAAAEDTQPEAEKETDQFVLKHLGEDKTVTREEIIPLAQKGMDYDRIRQKYDELTTETAQFYERTSVLDTLAKQQGFRDADELLNETRAAVLSQNEGLGIELARTRISLENRERELSKKEAGLLRTKMGEDSRTHAEELKQTDIMRFAQKFPDVKPTEIPNQVWMAVRNGESLVSAYIEHENSRLKAQMLAEKKNVENRERSAGSKSGVGNGTPEDEFTRAFREA